MSKQQKSVLDGIPTVCGGCGRTEQEHIGTKFPCTVAVISPQPITPSVPSAGKRLRVKQEIVGSCPQCGAPIYGMKTKMEGFPAFIEYSCPCRTPQSLQESMQTK